MPPLVSCHIMAGSGLRSGVGSSKEEGRLCKPGASGEALEVQLGLPKADQSPRGLVQELSRSLLTKRVSSGGESSAGESNPKGEQEAWATVPAEHFSSEGMDPQSRNLTHPPQTVAPRGLSFCVSCTRGQAAKPQRVRGILDPGGTFHGKSIIS